jgi:hypothetical protein
VRRRAVAVAVVVLVAVEVVVFAAIVWFGFKN